MSIAALIQTDDGGIRALAIDFADSLELKPPRLGFQPRSQHKRQLQWKGIRKVLAAQTAVEDSDETVVRLDRELSVPMKAPGLGQRGDQPEERSGK